VLDFVYGISAGIMMAASYFSLLGPALEASQDINPKWLPALVGLLTGAFFVRMVDWFLPEGECFDKTLMCRTVFCLTDVDIDDS